MTYKLFIDDERYPIANDWVIVRSSQAAIDTVTVFGIPSEIAFDHDLGGDDTSRVFIKWLANHMFDENLHFPVNFKFSVHSQNPVGVDWIVGTMTRLVQIYGDQND